MITVKATNFMGESLVLSPDKYAIKKISGLSPQGGTISTQKMARHGTEFINSTTDERNIVIDLKVLGDVEANREELYKIFPTSMPVTLELTTPKGKKATIEGYVETCEIDPYEMVTVGQISILCPDPFFKADKVVMEVLTEPVTIYSSCPFESGYIVMVTFAEAATGFTVTNNTNGRTLTLTGDFAAGDELYIDMNERSIFVGMDNGYNRKEKYSDWALLSLGENEIALSAPGKISFIDRYIGL